ncbi:MAG: AAA family ATPase [Candidatus Asgardarchaeia archaeon]
MPKFFDRKMELDEILGCIDHKINVLIYGLRGIGKTTLLEKIKAILEEKKKKNVIFINGYDIFSARDIFAILSDKRADTNNSAKDALTLLFAKNDSVIIVDEFTTLLQVFSRYDPFRNIEDVSRYIRTLLQNRQKSEGESVVISSSAVGLVRKLVMRYFAPLFREFKIIYIGPMDLHAIYELSKTYDIPDDNARKIALLSGGNPFYAKKLIEGILVKRKNPEEVLNDLLSPNGDLDLYFSSLISTLRPEERFILHLIARGISRFYELEKQMVKDPTMFLKNLILEGLILKVTKRKKFSEYFLEDNMLKAWLLQQDVPSLGRISLESIFVSSLSFEALIRETFRKIDKVITLKDFISQEVTIAPFKSVFNYKGPDFDIDMIGISFDNKACIAEVHFWGKATYKKVKQLLKNVEKYEKIFTYPISNLFLVSYFGFDLNDEEIEIVKKYKIALLSSRELKTIQRLVRKTIIP